MSPDTSAAVAAVDKQGERYDELAEKLRGRVDLAAKTFGGLATTAVTAIGIAKIADVYPLPEADHVTRALIATVGGFVAMAVAVIWLTARLWKVNQPVFLRTDLKAMEADKDIDGDERKELDQVFGRTARLNGVWTLAGYEARLQRLRRVLARTRDTGLRTQLEGAIAEAQADIAMTLQRGHLRLLRRRANRAVRGKGAWLLYAMFIGGIVAFALGSDYLSSARTEEVSIAKACAEARTAGATPASGLPGVCGTSQRQAVLAQVAVAKACADAREAGATDTTGMPTYGCGTVPAGDGSTVKDDPGTSPGEEEAAAGEAVSQALKRCEAQRRKDTKLAADACRRLRQALGELGGAD